MLVIFTGHPQVAGSKGTWEFRVFSVLSLALGPGQVSFPSQACVFPTEKLEGWNKRFTSNHMLVKALSKSEGRCSKRKDPYGIPLDWKQQLQQQQRKRFNCTFVFVSVYVCVSVCPGFMYIH